MSTIVDRAQEKFGDGYTLVVELAPDPDPGDRAWSADMLYEVRFGDDHPWPEADPDEVLGYGRTPAAALLEAADSLRRWEHDR